VSGGDVNKMFRDVYGITIAGGQDKLKGKIFRLGHLGYADGSDTLLASRGGDGPDQVGVQGRPGRRREGAQEVLLAENL
jgi:aspartate aminotransferase-like enzyme